MADFGRSLRPCDGRLWEVTLVSQAAHPRETVMLSAGLSVCFHLGVGTVMFHKDTWLHPLYR